MIGQSHLCLDTAFQMDFQFRLLLYALIAQIK